MLSKATLILENFNWGSPNSPLKYSLWDIRSLLRTNERLKWMNSKRQVFNIQCKNELIYIVSNDKVTSSDNVFYSEAVFSKPLGLA